MRTKFATFLTLALLVSLCIVPCGIVLAQEPVVEQWVQRYDGPASGDDNVWGRSIGLDRWGNAYVAGSSDGSGTGKDYTTIKYNDAGVEQWVSRYNGPGNFIDGATGIAIDSLGNVYVTGRSWGLGTLGDYATIKYNNAGVQQWVARYDGPGEPGNNHDCANAIAIDNAGNVYVTGISYGADIPWDGGASESNYADYATVKYNSAGIQQWVARYNGTGNGYDDARAIAVDGSGNVYVTGSSYGAGTGADCVTIKYNSAGVEQWVQRFAGPRKLPDWGADITADGFGNVYVTGCGCNEACNQFVTIKYNSNGVQQWATMYEREGGGWASAIALDDTSNVYVTGRSWGSGTIMDYDYTTVKYNNDGVQQWVQRYSGPGNSWDEANGIAIDNQGNVYITGHVYGRSGPFQDFVTIKYSSAGVQQWWKMYHWPENNDDYATGIAVDSSSNVYVTGYSTNSDNTTDFTTIKYAQQTVSVNTATGTGTATFSTSAGGIADITALANTACGTAPGSFPHGFFSFNIVSITPGSTVTLTITLPSAMPAGTQYWKCINGQWVDCTSLLGDNDGDNVLTLTLTDGGPGDGDGVANGIIVDPGGPAVVVGTPTSSSPRVAPAPPPKRPLNPPQLSVEYLSVNPQQTYANQPVTITTNVVNIGDEGGNYNVVLEINGLVEQTRMVGVGPQGTQPVKFTVSRSQPGTYAVDIAGQKGSFTVRGDSSSATINSGSLIAILVVGVLVILISMLLILRFRRSAN